MAILTNKTAFITGGTRGIGRAITELFAAEGAKVFFTGTNPEKVAEAASEIAAQCGVEPSMVNGIALDVRDVAAVNAALTSCGAVDVLVNNAGITRDNLMMRMSDDEWDDVLATDLKGVFNCMRAVARPMLKARCGHIVNIASVSGILGNAGQCNYSAAKAGVIGLTKAMAREFGSRGITVNAIAPGFVDTDMTSGLKQDLREKAVAQIPLGRMGKPSDIAQAALFLASDASAYITGQCLVVDGGLAM